MRDPFKIEPPFCVSFSGGRTSGYMLWRILQAHGGTMPADSVVLFANTGKEMPETLDFVERCSREWSVPIVWVEYRSKVDGKKRHAVVSNATASRAGEPFAALIRDRGFLPNPVSRFCTVELKIIAMAEYLRSIGWAAWDCAVGIRADEPLRTAKIRANPSGGTKGVERILPLVEAGITTRDVGEFWSCNDFDLALPSVLGKTMHGNCDLCFLKGASQTLSLVREGPSRANWWMEQERIIGARFRSDRPSYAEMHRMATMHGELFPFSDESIEDCACTD